MFEKTQSLGYLANHLARLMSRHLREKLEPGGLMPAQFTALVEISRDEGMTQKSLAERLDLEQPGIARTLGQLDKAGWIARKPDPADARAQRLVLTPKARDRLGSAVDLAVAVNDHALGQLSDSERAEILRLLAVVIDRLRGAAPVPAGT